ncbi:MAG: hypothetical protein KH230_09555 [Enterocloster asparagiformis]|nr:hypothetical protein [Enterocloster asparagiformis]
MNKRRMWYFLLIFILGMAAGFGLSHVVRRQKAPVAETGPSQAAQETFPYSVSQSVTSPENSAGDGPAQIACASRPAPVTQAAYADWDRETVYTGGDEAVYEGRLYRARWWTLGEIPGRADVWEDTGETPVKAVGALPENAAGSAQSPVGDTGGGEPDAAGQPADNAGLKVVGYYPDWKGYQPEKLHFDVLTHVVYAFAIPTPDGDLLPLEQPETAKRLIKDAHDNQVKVLLAVGGWSHNGAELEPVFMSATADAGKLRAFGDKIVAMCEQYGFDGIDMDWEHPRVDGTSKDQYRELMLYLADRLHGRGKLLTSAVISGVSADGNIYYDAAAHSDEVLNAVDWIHVMAYDGGDGERHSPFEFAVNCGEYWHTTRNMPREKVVLGLPFYGRPGWASYEEILAADPQAYAGDHAAINGTDVWYNGVAAVEQKARYAGEHLGGVMIWELTQDTSDREKSLLMAVGRGLN